MGTNAGQKRAKIVVMFSFVNLDKNSCFSSDINAGDIDSLHKGG